MFHRRSIQLAGLYLAILMLISLFFSANIYQLSVQEFEHGIRRPNIEFEFPSGYVFPDELRNQLQTLQENQYQAAKRHVLQRLILVNLVILVGGGVLCYYLALRTLRPIEEAHEALERFTADASHELRTPITAMRSENEVALMNPKLSLADAKRQLGSNVEELEKLSDLSTGLLRLASPDTATTPWQDIKPRVLIQQAVSRILPLAEKKGILISSKTSTRSSVMGDEASLTEALVILLDNAIKYSGEHTEVTVQATSDPRQVHIAVSDQGIGIKPAELPHIFERFYRADSARSKQHAEGYGLGLAIAKRIVDTHTGALSVTSKPGKGSTFTIHLPISNAS
jgi:signal transduction histidine kinase